MSDRLQKASLEARDFLLVELGESRKDRRAARRQRDKHVALIARIVNLANKAAPRSSIGEFHDGVMALLQEFSQFRDGGFVAAGIAGDAEQ